MKKECVLLELQMITGIMSNDMSYLYDEMMKGNTVVNKKCEPEFVEVEHNEDISVETDVDDWFSKL